MRTKEKTEHIRYGRTRIAIDIESDGGYAGKRSLFLLLLVVVGIVQLLNETSFSS